MNIIEQAESEGIHIRPMVKKYYFYFLGCVKQYGPEVVKQVLLKGRHNNYRLKFMHNMKDRRQMALLLDLH